MTSCDWCGALDGEAHNYGEAHPCGCWRCSQGLTLDIGQARAHPRVCHHPDGTAHLAGYLAPDPCPREMSTA